jgi:dTDP-glucose 4,6-dehydratase
LQFAEEVIRQTGSTSKIVFHELPEDDPKIRQPDISLAKKVLGWEPKIQRKEGLQITIEHFKKIVK